MRFLVATTILLVLQVNAWTRYEKRILTCSPGSSQCRLEFPDQWNRTVECRKEKIPEIERTPLNKDTLERTACPIGCHPHIIQKESAKNRKCLSYSTFGKYFDDAANDWFVWFCEPCESSFTTNCDFVV